MTQKNDAYTFISYSSNNREDAIRLYEVLTGKPHRITCWLDVMDLNSKEAAFQEQIIKGIKNASCLLLVETEESRKSDYVDLEVKTAKENNTPTFRYKVSQNKSGFVESLRMFLLAQRIRFRTTQPYWIALAVLISALAIMGAALFFIGRNLTPVFAEAINRSLPDAAQISNNSVTGDVQIAPEAAAPFHYSPDSIIQNEDFENNASFDSRALYFDIEAPNEEARASVADGSLVFSIPKACHQGNEYQCEIEIHGQNIEYNRLQYFAFRARIQSIAEGQNLSVSVSVPSWTRRRTGFGWNLSEHATPFFRSSPSLPEPDFYAHVAIDENWHAYEILLDSEKSLLYYYVDGQLIDSHQMKFKEEWKTSPLCLILYALGNGQSSIDPSTVVDTLIEIDQIIIGGFNE